MIAPPPRLIRRAVVAPLIVIGAVVGLGALPLWILLAAFMSRYVPGRWRVLRVAWFVFLYLALEAVALMMLFGLWIASGFGWKMRSARFVRVHYRLMAWWLRRVIGSARRTFKVEIELDEATEAIGHVVSDRPLIVFSQHAGPGDSLLLVDALLNGFGRRPRIVLKDLLQFDPAVDVVVNRLPNRFVPSSGRAGPGAIDAIRELTASMTDRDAFVIFPEGGNFTEARRTRAIEKLGEIGRPDLAARAEAMDLLLPPKPKGALTALAGAPDADILFVGHVGLEELTTVGDIWRGIPMDTNVIATWWLVRREDLPVEAEREAWLYDQWSDLNTWVGKTRERRSDERVDARSAE